MTSFDAIVVGLGAIGSATCYHLTRAGARVLGVEQFSFVHDLGSSHGQTRLVRRSYLAAPSYVSWIARSYQLWDELGRETGKRLFHRTGLLFADAAGERERNLQSAESLGISLAEVGEAFLAHHPGLSLPPDTVAYFEPDAGFVEAEASVEAHGWLARRGGAELRCHEAVVDLRCHADHVEVETAQGTYRASTVVVTAGPWSQDLLRDVGMSLVVRRLPHLWFSAGPLCDAERGMPCFSFQLPYGHFYGVPRLDGRTMKVCGGAERQAVAHPSHLDRRLHAADVAPVQRFIRECLPGVLAAEPSDWAMCMCTMTPDESFVVDRHPRHRRVVFAAGFSGHGFKLAPAMGELLAALATREDASPPGFLALRRAVTSGIGSRGSPASRHRVDNAQLH